MPSSLIVKCVPIKEVNPHPNADNLVLTKVMGWQVCEQKTNNPKVGDLRVFIPPDAILPDNLAKQLGVKNYLKKGNRVGQVKLRGEMSFGLTTPNIWNFEIGQEVSKELGITKWEPPEELVSGDTERPHPLFVNYTPIENFRNFPDIFKEGEKVVITEKIHGTNQKSGFIYDNESKDYIYMVGSHKTRKKLGQNSIYEKPIDKLRTILKEIALSEDAKAVIIYTEIFGSKVQDLQYGHTKDLAWRAFDIYVDGRFMNYDEAQLWFDDYDIPTVPMLYKGPFDELKVWDYAIGNTTLMKDNPHIREGVVVKPIVERTDPTLGRVILKFINDDYLLRKKGTERR